MLEIDRAEEQVKCPSLSSDTWTLTRPLGVFGTPLQTGEFMSMQSGTESGVDAREVELFSVPPRTSHESDIQKVQDAQASETRLQELYSSLHAEAAALDDTASNLMLQRERLSNELKQLVEEHRVLLSVQSGSSVSNAGRALSPPARHPFPVPMIDQAA